MWSEGERQVSVCVVCVGGWACVYHCVGVHVYEVCMCVCVYVYVCMCVCVCGGEGYYYHLSSPC